MENNQISAAITDASVESDGKKKLSCAKAFEIAEQFAISKRDIGQLCNENEIKIAACQLGCFK